MSLTNTYESLMLDAMLGDDHAPNMPATVYVGLDSVLGSDSTEPTECSGTGYARVAKTNNSTNWPDAVGDTKTNGTDVTFPEAGGAWTTPVGASLWDQLVGGNRMIYGSLAVSKPVAAGQTPTIAAGDMDLTAD